MAESFPFKTIRELAGLISGREVSPVELTQAFLDRLGEFGPHYNALVTLTAERALATAPPRPKRTLPQGAAWACCKASPGRQGPAVHRRRHPYHLGARRHSGTSGSITTPR